MRKCLKVGEEAVLELPGREMAWLPATFYASVESCELECKSLNGEIGKIEKPHDDVPDTDSLVLLLHPVTNCTQDGCAADPCVANACGNLKAQSKRAQLAIPTTVELDTSCAVLASREDVRRRLAAAEKKVARAFRGVKCWTLSSIMRD